jgi:hypothetical protein
MSPAVSGARAGLREVGLILVAALVYFGVRGLSQGRRELAFADAHTLLDVERRLGLAWEQALQNAVIDHHTLLTMTNWVYVYGHWPVIAACGVVLYVRDRDRYRVLRNAMIISGLCGFVFFAGFPVAPPRFADPGIVDTVTEYSHGYRALQPPALTNMYAAFPSLHAGWNLLVGIVVFRATTRLGIRIFAVAMPLAMAFAVVATANHWVLDVVGGTVIVLLALVAAERLAATTIREGERSRSTGPSARSPVRRRAQVRELPGRAASRRSARSAGDRGGRASLPGADGSPPPEDVGPRADPVGSLDAGEPVREAARPR